MNLDRWNPADPVRMETPSQRKAITAALRSKSVAMTGLMSICTDEMKNAWWMQKHDFLKFANQLQSLHTEAIKQLHEMEEILSNVGLLDDRFGAATMTNVAIQNKTFDLLSSMFKTWIVAVRDEKDYALARHKDDLAKGNHRQHYYDYLYHEISNWTKEPKKEPVPA